jgi:chromate transporter
MSTVALPTFSETLRTFFKIGCLGFGGPAGQIALMHRILVDEKKWIEEQRFLHALNFCMLLPGPEAMQLATYIGWLMHRTWGGLVAGALFVLPSLFILVALSWLYVAFGHLPAIEGLLYGIKPAVVAVVAFAAWRIGARTLHHPLLRLLAAAAFIAIYAFHAPFPGIVLAAALAGALGGRLAPAAFAPGGHRAALADARGPAVIDDATPIPVHARYRRRRLAGVVASFALTWALALALLAWAFGWNGTLPQMGWFFTKAALLTFGGAYAVLPYVFQGAVEGHGWLSASQMIDGLALGETTPGPLIMIVAFVGFVGGWTQPAFSAGAELGAGIAGACVATFFTFLPSFLFILAGGPLLEATHGQLRFTAPLTGITAAVVGVIANLALFFALHVFLPRGWQGGAFLGGFDAWAAGLSLAAALALFRYKAGVIPVIVACGAAGLVGSLAFR